jgi:integrase/recombinase XerC
LTTPTTRSTTWPPLVGKGRWRGFATRRLFKVAYAWGLRRRELVMLDVVDLHRNAQAPQFGSFGALHVRYGKASRGSPPKRRTVLSVHGWAVDALRQYVERVRGEFERGRH